MELKKNDQLSEKYISIVKDGSGVGRLNLCKSHSSILGTLTCLKSKNKKQYSLEWIYYLLHNVDFSVYVKILFQIFIYMLWSK